MGSMNAKRAVNPPSRIERTPWEVPAPPDPRTHAKLWQRAPKNVWWNWTEGFERWRNWLESILQGAQTLPLPVQLDALARLCHSAPLDWQYVPKAAIIQRSPGTEPGTSLSFFRPPVRYPMRGDQLHVGGVTRVGTYQEHTRLGEAGYWLHLAHQWTAVTDATTYFSDDKQVLEDASKLEERAEKMVLEAMGEMYLLWGVSPVQEQQYTLAGMERSYENIEKIHKAYLALVDDIQRFTRQLPYAEQSAVELAKARMADRDQFPH